MTSRHLGFTVVHSDAVPRSYSGSVSSSLERKALKTDDTRAFDRSICYCRSRHLEVVLVDFGHHRRARVLCSRVHDRNIKGTSTP